MHRIGRLHQHGAVAVGVICEDLIGNYIAGHHAADDRRLNHRALAGAAAAARDVLQIGRHVLRTFFAEMPAKHPNQLFEIADQRGVVIHLNAQVLEHRHALGLHNGVYCALDLRHCQTCMGAIFCDG